MKFIRLILCACLSILLCCGCAAPSAKLDTPSAAASSFANEGTAAPAESSPSSDISTSPEAFEPNSTDTGDSNSSAEMEAFPDILAFTSEWFRLYRLHEPAINNYDSANYENALTELAASALPFITATEYDLLLGGKDGRVTGNLPYSGKPGYVEKQGSTLIFGHTDELKADGFSEAEKAGDQIYEDGKLDLATGYFISEASTMRIDKRIARGYYQYKQMPDGSMAALEIISKLFTFQGNGTTRTQALYIIMSDTTFQFILAGSQMGVDFPKIPFENGMTMEQAASTLTDSGFAIEKTGTLQGGKLIVEILG